MAGAVADADAIVSLSKFKTHQFTLVTGAVKNCFGYIPGVAKAEYHLNTGMDQRRFAALLLDLYLARPPFLSVMDAVVGMEGNGPSNGTPREVGLLLAAPHAPDLDFVEALLMGFDPLEVPTIAEAAGRGLGPAVGGRARGPGGPRRGGTASPVFQRPAAHQLARVPGPLLAAVSRLFAVRPRVETEKCRRCGACSENCPPGAIERDGGVPRIRAADCIRCFCCQELCPADAIAIDRPLVRRLIG